MDAWLETARDIWDGPIDFEGQKMVEFASVAMLSGVGVLAFIFGFITQDITTTVILGLGGSALAFLFTVPPWPLYNKHPVPWLTSTSSAPATSLNIVVDGKKVE